MGADEHETDGSCWKVHAPFSTFDCDSERFLISLGVNRFRDEAAAGALFEAEHFSMCLKITLS